MTKQTLDEIDRLKAVNAELLAVLKAALPFLIEGGESLPFAAGSPTARETIARSRAAIAKAS